MNIDEHINYWVELSEHDLLVAENLFQNGHYSWCLYIGHLILERILKAVYVKHNQSEPPRTHDLLKLAKATKLNLDEEQEEFLNRATDFNIEARYPDYKSKFYKLCTKEFTEENFNKIKMLYQWIKKQTK